VLAVTWYGNLIDRNIRSGQT